MVARSAPAAIASPPTSRRIIGRAVVAGAATIAFAAALLVPASAAPGDTSTDTTDAHIGVSGAISLSGLTSSFTLNGLPGATVTGAAAVTMNVSTNNLAGYDVTVQSQTDTIDPDLLTNPDSIPIGALSVRKSGSGAYTALDGPSGQPVTVVTKAARSAAGGDAVSNDYQIAIPFVNTGTYTATLDYIATTL
jgi:hypothetical protein